MTKLALATVTLLASQAAGCIIHTNDRDRGDHQVDVATISAQWSLRNMADGATTPCPVGFDTAQLIALPIDANGNQIGDEAIDLFNCSNGTGRATDLVPDIYQVWVEIRSSDLRSLYAQSLSQVLDLRDADDKFTTELLNDGGYFQLAWDLIGKNTNRPVNCSQVAALNTLSAVSTNIASATFTYDDTFVCEDHSAVSGGLLQGSYTIAIDAIAGDKSVGKATTLTGKVNSQNQITDLGTISIPIEGL
jgi:hypothetical protein